MMQEQKHALAKGFDAVIDAWLIERQALLTQFVALPQMSVSDNVVQMLHTFCEAMVDYSSRGHFNVYEQLLRHISEHNAQRLDVANVLLQKIHDTTDKSITFDSRYWPL